MHEDSKCLVVMYYKYLLYYYLRPSLEAENLSTQIECDDKTAAEMHRGEPRITRGILHVEVHVNIHLISPALCVPARARGERQCFQPSDSEYLSFRRRSAM